MLSYRHSFHAGNHADVLKHSVLLAVLNYLLQKEKPLCVIDTHSGAGRYKLGSSATRQTGESDDGIARLWQQTHLPALLVDYLAAVKAINPSGSLEYYPGSPCWVLSRLRSQDQFHGFELHPADFKTLQRQKSRAKIRLEQTDGFKGLIALLPPASRRGLIVIDPSYEIKTDYEVVVTTLKAALKRFANGCYLVWYPLLDRPESRQLPKRLEQLGAERWLNVTLTVRAAQSRGMYGSGLWLINPPYVLPEVLEEALPVLVELLGQDDKAGYSLNYRLD